MDRIYDVLIKDKFSNLEQVSEILKEEVTSIARNFFLLADDLVVRFRRQGNNFVFNIEIEASRIKPFGSRLP
ncbi:MAG: hypothetical protein J6K39_01850 [Clostridia bacterium]|nr:hypothetical protein [Clostridia bacterium]